MTETIRTLRVNDFDKFIEDSVFATKPRGSLYRDGFKRVLDVILVLIAALPVMIVIGMLALIVARDGASPFYFQKRVGRGGRVFRMMKLRSMVPNADSLLEAHLAANPEARAEWDRDQKLRNDPRITPIGRIIRKASFDELPQLWNVLKGDMALVGPRPMMVEQQVEPAIRFASRDAQHPARILQRAQRVGDPVVQRFGKHRARTAQLHELVLIRIGKREMQIGIGLRHQPRHRLGQAQPDNPPDRIALGRRELR